MFSWVDRRGYEIFKMTVRYVVGNRGYTSYVLKGMLVIFTNKCLGADMKA